MNAINILYSFIKNSELSTEPGTAVSEKQTQKYATILGIKIDSYFRDTAYGARRFFLEKRCKEIIDHIQQVYAGCNINLYLPSVSGLKEAVSPQTYEILISLCTLREIDQIYSDAQQDIDALSVEYPRECIPLNVI